MSHTSGPIHARVFGLKIRPQIYEGKQQQKVESTIHYDILYWEKSHMHCCILILYPSRLYLQCLMSWKESRLTICLVYLTLPLAV